MITIKQSEHSCNSCCVSSNKVKTFEIGFSTPPHKMTTVICLCWACMWTLEEVIALTTKRAVDVKGEKIYDCFL